MAATDKHDAGCRRRKVEWDFPYLCTCDLTDEAVLAAVKQGRPKLKPDGKPMRALRVLAERDESLDEDSIYWRAVRYGPTSGSFHEALRRLTRLGLAERTRASDFYRYAITLAGREYLEDR